MNVLFICSANIDRSKTAEVYFSAKYPQHAFRSAGTNLERCRASGTTALTREHLEWANKVFAMEEKHKAFVHSIRPVAVNVLAINDDYTFMDQKLIDILEKKVHI